MDEEKREDLLKRNAHKLALGGQAIAVLLIVFMPFMRRRREQRHARPHGRFAILGH